MNNEKIAYWLSLLWRSWFWLGIWVFYYLRFTDYAGIGLLESVMITTSTLGEIPTGAIADILGKKKAVVIAFIMGATGNFFMALSPNYATLILSIVIMTLGGAFYSGSLEALVYDSLKQQRNEKRFQKVLGRMTTMQNAGMALAGITGGFLYSINVMFPFMAVGVAYLIGAILSLRLEEPKLDSEKYSWSKFVKQNVMGFKQLFSNKQSAWMSASLLVPSMFMVATENVLNDATAVELGFDSIGLGILATLIYFSGIVVAESSDKIFGKLSKKWLYVAIVIVYATTLLIIPKVGILFGAAILIARYMVQTLYGNWESVQLNQLIESRYRATTLSTYNLLRNVPYVLGATGIGYLMSAYTARQFSVYFGLVFMAMVILATVVRFVANTRD